jgi:hypothetical protein
VLLAEVPRGERYFCTPDARDEAEAVLTRAPAASVDGTLKEWQSRYEAVLAARRARSSCKPD